MTNRRHFLSQASLLGAGLMLPEKQLFAATNSAQDQPQAQPPGGSPPGTFEAMPAIGATFNESQWLEDSFSGRKLLRLTSKRQYNQMPTYHLFSGFSEDSKYLAFASFNVGADSALILADVTNGECKVLDKLANSKDGFFDGNNVAMLAAAEKVAAVVGRYLWVYDVYTGEKKELAKIEANQVFGHPAGLANGTEVIVPVMKAYDETKQKPDDVLGVEYWVINVRDGKKRVAYTDQSARNNHVIPNPRNPDLAIIDRDWAPGFAHGGDGGLKSRTWILNLKTQQIIEVKPQDSNRFQIHSNWSYDGRHVYYHGMSASGRQDGPITGRKHYVGVASTTGQIVHEWLFPHFFYGHVGSHSKENAIITDGLFTNDLVSKINWQDLDFQGRPKIEVLCRHESDWHKGQMSHPHCLVSNDGKYMAFNRGVNPRSDVYLLQLL